MAHGHPSLQGFLYLVPDETHAEALFHSARWPDGPICRLCGSVGNARAFSDTTRWDAGVWTDTFLLPLCVSGIRVICTGLETVGKTEEPPKFIMSVQDRIKKYRTEGGAAGFVRVEVLVPPAGRERVRAYARQLRENHRAAEEELEAMCRDAIARFGVRVLDNIDPDRLPTAQQRARVIGRALMDKGGLAGFKLGRQLVKQAEALDGVERAPGEDHADTGTEPL